MNDRVRVDCNSPVARVTLNRGDRHNGVDLAMLSGVRAAARRLRRDRNVRAVILEGEGPSFCAGLDVKSVLGRPVARLIGLAALCSPVRNGFQAVAADHGRGYVPPAVVRHQYGIAGPGPDGLPGPQHLVSITFVITQLGGYHDGPQAHPDRQFRRRDPA